LAKIDEDLPGIRGRVSVVVLRKNGGARGEFNPIRKQQAELRSECNSMLRDVQTFVRQHQEVCSAL